MAKAKRANHRTGSERADEPGWEAPAVTGSAAAGANGHDQPANGHAANGHPPNNGQPSNGRPSNGQPPQNGRPPQQPGQQGAPPMQAWRTVQVQQNGQPAVPQQQRVADLGTPVKVDEIAIAAKTLSENLQAAARGLPESVASRQFRRDLDDAADTFREAANDLETTATNLLRLAANEGQTCGVTWGACPDHGLTLMNVGEVVTCHVLGCHREYEGVIERCTQPVAYRVVDAAGPALLTCAGHAIACRLHLDGAVITLASDSLELL
jgi:hypothetical protein